MAMGDPMEIQIKDCLPVLIDKWTARLFSGKVTAGDRRMVEQALLHAMELEQALVPVCRRVTEELANMKPNRRLP